MRRTGNGQSGRRHLHHGWHGEQLTVLRGDAVFPLQQLRSAGRRHLRGQDPHVLRKHHTLQHHLQQRGRRARRHRQLRRRHILRGHRCHRQQRGEQQCQRRRVHRAEHQVHQQYGNAKHPWRHRPYQHRPDHVQRLQHRHLG